MKRFLIVGQGISGTWLSYWLLQQGAHVVVLDDAAPHAASRVASGVINPVTGRQVVTTWQADTLLPFAEKHYTALGQLLGLPLLHNTGIAAFPPSQQMQEAYQRKMAEASPYVHPLTQENVYADYFHFNYGGVHIKPAYWVDLAALLPAWRAYLSQKGLLYPAVFDESKLHLKAGSIYYEALEADCIIYCSGIHTAQSAYWQGLPFSFNKGEALLVRIPLLPPDAICKFGISTLVPWQPGIWWVGSTYDNRFTHSHPESAFRKKTETFLHQTLKVPFEVVDHLAAIRPATVERRPFAGLHPAVPQVCILNGMGTKGVSLAPWLGQNLAEHLLQGAPLLPEADVRRFRRAFL